MENKLRMKLYNACSRTECRLKYFVIKPRKKRWFHVIKTGFSTWHFDTFPAAANNVFHH